MSSASDFAGLAAAEALSSPLAMLDAEASLVLWCNPAFAALQAQAKVPSPGALVCAEQPDRLAARVAKRGVFEHPAKYSHDTGTRALFWRARRLDDGRILLQGDDDSRTLERDALIQSYTRLVEEKTAIAERERERAERLLLNVLPQRVIEDLQSNGVTKPELYKSVSVLFLDFVGFTNMPVSRQPELLFAELNDIYTNFDEITEHFGCERIKTIGDAYLAVAGMPDICADHALRLTRAARAYLKYLIKRNRSHPVKWLARIGIHSGEAIGGVVGVRKYIYDVFGDAINTAARMEAAGQPMRVNISEATHRLIGEHFACDPRPLGEVKGKGLMQMYFVRIGPDDGAPSSAA